MLRRSFLQMNEVSLNSPHRRGNRCEHNDLLFSQHEPSFLQEQAFFFCGLQRGPRDARPTCGPAPFLIWQSGPPH